MVTSIIPLYTEMNQELKIRNLWQIDRVGEVLVSIGAGWMVRYWGKWNSLLLTPFQH